MAHVRFTRDKRGYEHTFLVHRGAGGGDASVLYWFRTPPDVRVGRRPLDEETAQAIEEAFPNVRFDWPRIRETQAARAAGEERAAHSRPDGRGGERRLLRRRGAGRSRRDMPAEVVRPPGVKPDDSS